MNKLTFPKVTFGVLRPFLGMVSILVKTLVYILSELERFLQKQYEVVGKWFLLKLSGGLIL